MTKVKTTKRLLARVILRSGEKILFAYNKKDAFYFLPGGHVDPNESVSDALMRELVEETNLKPTEISAPTLLCVYENTWRDRNTDVFELILCFSARLKASINQESVSSREKHLSFHFLSAKELGDVDFRPAKMKPMVIESLSSASSNLTYFPLGGHET